ncbi:hypothetical protein KIL84_019656 [Mauremys mutica]|uniref:Uncharacterized protein n=1 Tax=Mauremys mutica TaxID=74926 RepID=A0A9D3XVP4_9SAUR|nr:hypothetical protein KIL84_019656 [Mauremys mutica]
MRLGVKLTSGRWRQQAGERRARDSHFSLEGNHTALQTQSHNKIQHSLVFHPFQVQYQVNMSERTQPQQPEIVLNPTSDLPTGYFYPSLHVVRVCVFAQYRKAQQRNLVIFQREN